MQPTYLKLFTGSTLESAKKLILGYQMQKEALQELIDTNKTLGQSTDIELFNVKPTMKSLDQLEAKLLKITTDNVSGDVTTTETTLVDVTGPTANEANAREYELAFEHQRKMADLNASYLGRLKAQRSEAYGVKFEQQRNESRLAEISRRKDIDDLKQDGRDTLKTLGSHYKAAFALNKAFAIKDALINTYNGVAKAMNNIFPLNLGFAAVALANGMAQVAAIRSTQFRANGGPVTANSSPYIVGEQGRELFVPNTAGNIVPNDQLSGGNFTINISANDTAGFDELLTKRRGTLMNLINQSLNERGRPALA
jgi:hypothetical protein